MTQPATRTGGHSESMSGEHSISVSIVVLNWNGKEMLSRCLDTLREVTAHDDYRVVVVDNGSTDGSVEMVSEEFEWVDLVTNDENLGFSKGNNVGIKYAFEEHDPDAVLLLNNDIEFRQERWLEYLVDSLTRPQIGIVGCKLLYPDGTIQHAGGQITYSGDVRYQEDVYNEPTALDRLEFVLGACMLIDRAVIDEIGLLDEGFSPLNWEETDYYMRCRAAGYELLYDPRAHLIHHEKKSKEAYENQSESASEELSFFHKKNQLRFMILNFGGTELLRRLPTECKELTGCFIGCDPQQNSRLPGSLYFHENPFARLWIFLKAYFVNVANLPEIIPKRYDRTRYIDQS